MISLSNFFPLPFSHSIHIFLLTSVKSERWGYFASSFFLWVNVVISGFFISVSVCVVSTPFCASAGWQLHWVRIFLLLQQAQTSFPMGVISFPMGGISNPKSWNLVVKNVHCLRPTFPGASLTIDAIGIAFIEHDKWQSLPLRQPALCQRGPKLLWLWEKNEAQAYKGPRTSKIEFLNQN